MYPLLDLDQFRVRMPLSSAQEGTGRRRKPPRHRGREKFLKGPVPLTWLELAARLPGRALHVGIVIWFLAGLTDCRTVALSSAVLLRFGVDPRSSYRALVALERAHLVTVQRRRGRHPRVTLLEVTG
jgi:DNA-binding transcriptional ArsR family regulator